MLRFPPDPTLAALDSALNRFVTFCASYHGESLHSIYPPCSLASDEQNSIFKVLSRLIMLASLFSNPSSACGIGSACVSTYCPLLARSAKVLLRLVSDAENFRRIPILTSSS
jgi:hypothetical protein